ncbi:hypothetical protein DL770_007802 [Monosporascus sp. CRB-9-2]|nr:hypothetical protein DL770_007802 [Monosporascus sp. CRB-9-2]
MIIPKTVASLVPLAALAAAQGQNPVINPELSRQQIWEGLLPHMPAQGAAVHFWEPGWIYESCKHEAEIRGLNPNDIEVFNVHYGDCGEPWIMCRHRAVTSPTRDEMIDIFGRLPVNTRQYIRHVNVFPDLGNGAAGLFYNYNIMFGNGYMDLYVLIHESAHALDYGARPDVGSPFSETSAWQNAYFSDSASPTPYGQTSWVEGYAEIGPLGFYDKHVPGGLGNIQPNKHQIQNQLNTFTGYLNWVLDFGGTCGSRLPNTEPVPMSNSFRVNMVNKPDVSFKSNVTVMDLPETPRIATTKKHLA